MVRRAAGFAVPKNRGFALVGDADGGDIVGGCRGGRDRFFRGGQLACPQFIWIVLDPSGAGINLAEFFLGHGADGSRAIEQDRPRASGSLIQGEDEGHGNLV